MEKIREDMEEYAENTNQSIEDLRTEYKVNILISHVQKIEEKLEEMEEK